MRSGWTLGSMVLAVCASACAGAPAEATSANPFRGRVLGESTTCDGGICGSVFRRGFAQGTELTLTFDPDVTSGSPGTLTTTGPSGAPEPCGATLVNEPLLPIESLVNDQLSLYDFPGAGRVRNYIFSIEPTTGPLAGRDAIVFLSFLRGDRAEVRILVGSGAADCAPTDCPSYAAQACDYFGVFPMRRSEP